MTDWPQLPDDMVKESEMCFACGQKNPIGLKLQFRQEGPGVIAEFTPGENHQGWTGLVHGGIICCLLDEAMSYATLSVGASCVTARMQTRFKRPLPVGERLTVTGSITKKTRRLVETRAELNLDDGTPVAESTATMFIANPEKEFKNNA